MTSIRVAAGLGMGLLVFVLVDFPYWRAQIFYHWPRPQPVAVSASAEDGPPDWLIIEKLGIEAPIVYVEQADESVFQEGLRRGVVHYPGTAPIGEAGNPYIFGHSSDYIWSKGHYQAVFAVLPEIKTGEAIVVSDHAGKKFVYKVVETKVVGPRDVSVLDQQDYQRKLLTLQTSYPVGTALRRFVVIAELADR